MDLSSLPKRLESLPFDAEGLAKAADVHVTTAYRWLSGARVPRKKALKAIANAAQVRLEWLESGKPPQRSQQQLENAIASAMGVHDGPEVPLESEEEAQARKQRLRASVADFLDDPESRSEYDDLARAGRAVVAEARDANGRLLYALRVEFLAVTEPGQILTSHRIEDATTSGTSGARQTPRVAQAA